MWLAASGGSFKRRHHSSIAFGGSKQVNDRMIYLEPPPKERVQPSSALPNDLQISTLI